MLLLATFVVAAGAKHAVVTALLQIWSWSW